MFKKVISFFISLTLLASSLFTFTGCDNADSGWNYTKDESGEFIEEEGYLYQNPYNTKFVSKFSYQFFNDTFDADDVLIFDYTKLCADIDSGITDMEYLSYDVVKEYEVAFTDFEKEDNYGFTVYFDSSDTDLYCAIIHKDANLFGKYVLIYSTAVKESGDTTENGVSFESLNLNLNDDSTVTAGNGDDDLAQEVIDKCDSAETAEAVDSGLDIAVNVASMLFSIYSGDISDAAESGIGCVHGIIGIFSSTTSVLKGISQQVSNLTKKVDTLTETVRDNQTSIENQFASTQTGIDFSILTELDSQITQFYDGYTKNNNDFYSEMNNAEQGYLEEFISQNETITVYYDKDNKRESSYKYDKNANDTTFTFNLTDFTNAKSAVSNNVLQDNFDDQLKVDIKANLAGSTEPSFCTEDDLVNDIYNEIIEEFYISYFTDSKDGTDRTNTIGNLATDYAKAVSGNGPVSVLSTYQKSMQYSYCFASECKSDYKSFCAGVDASLLRLQMLAEIAYYYNGLNASSIRTEMDKARTKVKEYSDAFTALDDNYCFITNTVLKASFGRMTYNYDNISQVKPALALSNEYADGYKEEDCSYLTLDSVSVLSRSELLLIENRSRRILNESDFLNYLNSVHVIDSDSWNYATALSDKNLSENYLRFFTEFANHDMTSDDYGKYTLKCTKSLATGDYFKVGETYEYGKKHSKKHWSGEYLVANCSYFSGTENGTEDQETVCTFARYAEYHTKRWKNQEDWTFASTSTSHGFILYS